MKQKIIIVIFALILLFSMLIPSKTCAISSSKDEVAVGTVEFYPPDGLNSADLAFIYKS